MTTDTHNDQPEDLMQTQFRLEEEMTKRGYDSYIHHVAQAKEKGHEDSTAHGQTILRGRIGKFEEVIAEWMAQADAGVAGYRQTAYIKLKGTAPDVLAFIGLKNILTGISVVRTFTSVAINIGRAIEDEIRFKELRENERKAYDSIVAGAVKRGSYQYKHVYAVRRADLMEDGWESWTTSDRLHVGVKMLDLCIEGVGLIEISNEHNTENSKSARFIRPTEEALKWIEKKNEATAMLRPVYEPMVVTPKDWTTPNDGGYITSNIRPLSLVKSGNAAYQEELEHTDMPIVYAAVNALQRTAWNINTDVLDVIKELWKGGSTLAGVPHKEGLPFPPKPHDINENEDARKAYRAEASKVHLLNLQSVSKRISFNYTLSVAERYAQYREVFIPYTLDFRGRIYAVPHLNPQGNDYQKALLRFANGKALGAEGWKWLAIHGANVIGNDKITLAERVQFILDNSDQIVAITKNPYDNRGWCGEIGGIEVDKPWQTLAFCFEWAGYVRQGEGFISRIPVAMDGSCSGMQHFSAMLRDSVGGAAVNLVPMEKPADVYRMVAGEVIEQLEGDLNGGTEDSLAHNDAGEAYVKTGTKSLARQWLDFGITRNTTKRAVMTTPYGSKVYGFRDQLMEDILDPARLAGDQFPFAKDGYVAAGYMAKAIWAGVQSVLVKATEAMNWLQAAAQIAAKENLPVRWTTAVGFPVMQAYQDLTERRIRTALCGKMVKTVIREPRAQVKLDIRAQGSGIAPNFIHSVDASHLMLTTVRASQEGITNFAMIHDSFGTTAADVPILYRVVRESFVEMYETADVLQQFKTDIVKVIGVASLMKLPPLPEKGNLDLSGVLESQYCFA